MCQFQCARHRSDRANIWNRDTEMEWCTGVGVVFPMGLFHPPGPPLRVRIGQMMSPPLSPSKSPLNRFFIGLQMLLPRTFCGQCMFFAFVGKRWRWGCFPRLSVFVFRLIRRWIYWHRLHQLTNCTDDNLWGRGWDEVRWGTWGWDDGLMHWDEKFNYGIG